MWGPQKGDTYLGATCWGGHIHTLDHDRTLVPRLSVRDYVTLHTYGWVGFFKPTMAEVAKQLPAQLFDDFDEIYVTTRILSDNPAHVADEHHVAVTTVGVRDKDCQ
jgi:hypothetical protein